MLINHKSIKMKKLIFLISLFSFTLNAQKSIGSIKTEDELTKKAIEANQAYLNQDFNVWDENISDDAIIYINNSKMDKNSYI